MPSRTRKSKLPQEEAELDEALNCGSDSEDEDASFCHECGAPLAADARFCGKCGAKRQQVGQRVSSRCCACSCTLACLLLVGVVALLMVTFNSWLKYAIEGVGSALTGTPVSLAAVTLNPMRGRVTLSDLAVASSQGYEGANFLFLDRFVFDVGPMTLMGEPILLEEVFLNDLEVFISISMLPSLGSNVDDILSHAKQVTRPFLPSEGPPPPDVKTSLSIMEKKIQVNRLTLANISCTVRVVAMTEVKFQLETIELKDIGKNEDGVYLFQFINILVQAVLMSVLKAAPVSVRAIMASDFGSDLSRGVLDFGSLHVDLGGGLEKVTNFAGWVTAEAALLPLRMASAGTTMTGKALEIGSELTGIGAKAQLAATNAQVNMGVKATEEMAKLSTDFTTGMTQALTGR